MQQLTARHPPASDVLKPRCPWCGASTSGVYTSRGVAAGYQRRRRCVECGRTWPTLEVLDRARFVRDLVSCGLTFAALGLTDD